MEIASARPMERFAHTHQVFDNSYNFGTGGGTLLQFTTGSGADRPSCMFSFDNLNQASISSTPSALKSSKLLKENAISLSSFTCKRRLDFNHLTLANSVQLHNENVNNNNNMNSINNNNNNISHVDANNSVNVIEKNSHPQQHHEHHQQQQQQQVNSHPSHRHSQHHRQQHQVQQQQHPHRRTGNQQNQVKPVFTAVQRRNERERNRVKLINMTFATLREHLPNGTKGSRSKKMSKVETLKAAIEYIRYLRQLVDEHDAVSAVLDNNVLTSTSVLTSSSTLASSSSLSPDTSMSSPNPSSCSDSSCEGISVDEDDLLDFSNWF